jgi:hypothetical protein
LVISGHRSLILNLFAINFNFNVISCGACPFLEPEFFNAERQGMQGLCHPLLASKNLWPSRLRKMNRAVVLWLFFDVICGMPTAKLAVLQSGVCDTPRLFGKGYARNKKISER